MINVKDILNNKFKHKDKFDKYFTIQKIILKY